MLFVSLLERETALHNSANSKDSRISCASVHDTYDEIPDILVSDGQKDAPTLIPKKHDELETRCDDDVIEYEEVNYSMGYEDRSVTPQITSNQVPEKLNDPDEELSSSDQEDKHKNENYAVLGERYDDHVYQSLLSKTSCQQKKA